MPRLEYSERPSIDGTHQQRLDEPPTADGTSVTLDLESQSVPGRNKKGSTLLSLLQQRDTRLIVAPRCTAAVMSCAQYAANDILRAYQRLEVKKQAGEDGGEVLKEELYQKCTSYVQFLVHTNQILKIDQPNKTFLRNLRPVAKEILGDEGETIFLDEPIGDYVSLSEPDQLDRIISLIPFSKFGRWLFRPFLAKREEFGNSFLVHYHEMAMRGLIFTGFSAIIGVFACAPVAIQSLNVDTAAGEVATYLVFMIVFGWLMQVLAKNFDKLLLTSLAYAGVMATVMPGRQGQ
ncbi:hypothetical protein FZEAL_8831 [Fusarium zealandicum]|uniref:Uncharacterized protein n=1 Tax=Fusarium zealandicum TaxID=1053134 RepID=A0A8H4UDP4_9HYPO|nr:hypothetical protein FZEAL_8831 [Fusarium zealandicum]